MESHMSPVRENIRRLHAEVIQEVRRAASTVRAFEVIHEDLTRPRVTLLRPRYVGEEQMLALVAHAAAVQRTVHTVEMLLACARSEAEHCVGAQPRDLQAIEQLHHGLTLQYRHMLLTARQLSHRSAPKTARAPSPFSLAFV